jgi:uncharacterized protein YndB with AHSA1/START domain
MAQSPLETKPSLSITRHYPVAPEKVWRAWTDPQALSHWFGPGEADSVTRAELDVRPGGRYRIAFRTQDGEEHEVSGEYQEVETNRKLAFTWAWKSTPERVSLVTVEMRPSGEGCELNFLHERFFDRQARDNHERGWTGTFEKLDSFVVSS